MSTGSSPLDFPAFSLQIRLMTLASSLVYSVSPSDMKIVVTFLPILGKYLSLSDSSKILTTAGLADGIQAENIAVIDTTGAVNSENIEQLTGLKANIIDLAQLFIADGVEVPKEKLVEAAIAYGAALGIEHKAERVDFRKDFLPYQGKREALMARATGRADPAHR